MNLNETFHPRLIISDHFDKLINQIDIYTETFIHENFFKDTNDQEEMDEDLIKINKMRDNKIKKLTEMKQKHLSHWTHLNSSDFETEWFHIINDSTLRYDEKLNKIKEKLIFSDGILIEANNDGNMRKALKMNLWIMPFYLNETNAQFIR